MIDLRGLRPWGGLLAAPPETARIVVAGIPYDGSAVYRRGAAQAPAAVRALSAVMPPVSERGLFFGDLTIHDLGELDLGPFVESGWPAVRDALAAMPAAAFLTVFGGDHCSAVPVLAAQAARHPGLGVVWIDAHPDLNQTSRGGEWTCGCALRRALEVAAIEPGSVVLLGCRDFDSEEVDHISAQGITIVTAAEMAEDPAQTSRALARLAGRPVHVSFDIDVLDPAFAPGTEVASAGGLSTRQAIGLLAEAARTARVVGLDVCEVCPPLDHTEITSLAALKLVFEAWARLGNS